MEILKMIKRRWFFPAFLMLLLIPSAAWASGADVTIDQVKKYDNSIVSISHIKLLYGSTALYDTAWDFGADTFGFGPGVGDDLSVKATAWDSNTPATAPNASKHYGFLSGSTSGPGDNAASITGSIKAIYRAAAPFDPQISSVVEARTTNMITDAVSGTLTIKGGQKLPGNGEDAEITDYLWKYWKDSGAPTEVPTTGDLVLQDATGPATYHFQLALRNQWGITSYCAPEDYEFGGGGGASSFKFTLKPAQADKLIVNDIAIPSKNISYPEVATINKASELAGVINRKAGRTVVSAISRWNATAAKAEGVTFDGSGRVLSGIDFDLVPGYGVQVYTTEEIEITLQGQ